MLALLDTRGGNNSMVAMRALTSPRHYYLADVNNRELTVQGLCGLKKAKKKAPKKEENDSWVRAAGALAVHADPAPRRRRRPGRGRRGESR